MSKELRIGAPGGRQASGSAFAVSRDSGGILIGVRDNAAPQFAVSRDACGLLLSVSPAPRVAHVYVIKDGYYNGPHGVYARDDYYGPNYENARAGIFREGAGSNLISVGQFLTTYPGLYQAYLRFDSSVIPDDETVVGAVLSLSVANDYSDTDFIIEARAYDAGVAVAIGDYVAGAALSALPLFGTCATAGGLGSSAVFTEAEGAAAMVNTGGFTGFLLCSDHTTNDIAPTGPEWVQFNQDQPLQDLVTLTITTSGPA